MPFRSSHSGGVVVVLSTVSVVVVSWCWYSRRKRHRRRQQQQHRCRTDHQEQVCSSYESMIGNTPCILLPYVSQLIDRKIYVKLESWNPGGTGKDRAARSMIAAAEAAGQLPEPHTAQINNSLHLVEQPLISDKIDTNSSDKNETSDDAVLRKAMLRSRTGGLIVEGTSGSTGIALAAIAVAKGHACLIIMPDDQANEKRILLEVLGATVHVVPPASIANPHHYVNLASRFATRAKQLGIQAAFMNQFENMSNFNSHSETTGPEIWRQCQPNAFVMSAGTGGTIGGVSMYLKSQGKCRTVLVDPIGSVLYSKIEHGVAFAPQQKERSLLRHRYDSIAEGIGLDRITANMVHGLPFIDSALVVTDQEAVDMAHFLLEHEGLLVGSSSAMNLVGAIRTALDLEPKCRVCTVICDSGQRHVTRFWNREFILSRGLTWPRDSNETTIPECLRAVL